MSPSRHDRRYPGESAAYRAARDELLEAEIALRAELERVAAMRRALPPGGAVPEDYAFEGEGGEVRLSSLFGPRPDTPTHDTLVLYSFMYAPAMERACPMCTSFLDALDGEVPHLEQRLALAVVARSPYPRVRAFGDEREWRHLRLLSSAACDYNRDYFAEDEGGGQLPALNVFRRTARGVEHVYATEMLYADVGGQPRHVDLLWPLWNVLDLTPEGRGTDWYPALSYPEP